MRKMIPSKSEKSGRRSSILKPMKLRNPLETVAASSTESSPSKLKRRVSFAEKKHVKEFCDSMEQGTVWDSTYEESEASQIRSLFSPTEDPNCPASTPQPEVNNPEDNPNFPESSPKIFDLPNHSRHTQKRISILELNFLGPQAIEDNPQFLADKENIPMNPMTLENPGEDDPLPEDSRTQNSQKFEVYCDDESSFRESRKDGNLTEDKTLTLTNSMCLNMESEMSMTKAITSVLDNRKINKSVFSSEGMEMTEAIDSIFPVSEIPEKTQIFHQNGMEMTEAIHSLLPGAKILEKTHNFEENGMEMTEAIHSLLPGAKILEKTQNFQQNGMEMTEAIPSVLNIHKQMDSTILNNEEMVMTEAIGFAPTDINPEKTEVFPNGMDMTEAIPSILNIQRRIDETIPNNPGMEMTEAIPSILTSQRSKIIPEDSKEIENNERTELFQGGMEMTEAIPSLLPTNKILQNNENELASLKRSYQTISSENSCDPILSSPSAKSSKDHDPPQKIPSQEDQIALHLLLHGGLSSNLQNQSMEFTTAITSHLNSQKNPIPRISEDDSMEMTEVIPSFTSFSQSQKMFEALKTPEVGESLDSSDSLKENRVPEDIPKRPVSRPLFEQEDEVSEPTAKPLENSQEFMEQLRLRGTSLGRNIEDLTVELTRPIGKSFLLENGSLTSSDIQDVEAPSYLFTEENGDYSSLLNEEEMEGFGEKSVENDKQEEVLENISRHVKIGGDEMTIDIGAVGVPDVEFTEEIGRRTRVIHKNEEIMKKPKIIREEEINEESQLKTIDYSQSEIENLDFRRKYRSKNIVINSAVVLENDTILKSIQKSNLKHEALIKKRACTEKIPESNLNNSEKLSEVIEDDSALNPFELMKKNVEKSGKLRTCLWEILRISEEKIFISFIKTGLVFGVIFKVPESLNELERIREIYVIPRLSEKETAVLRMTDRLILEHIDRERLKTKFKTYDDVLGLINFITEEVKVVYDFYEEIQRMSLTNMMEILDDKLWFLARTKSANTILKIFLNIKALGKIGPEDVDVVCLLGNVRVNDVKNLIKNVKRNHKFLTFYRNDVCDYIELMEESSSK